MAVRIEPFSDFIILDPVEESQETEMGLVIPDNAGKDKPRIGKVLEIGPEVTFCKVGEMIVFSPYSGEKVSVQVSPVSFKEYHVVREDALIGRYHQIPDENAA